MDTLRNRLHEHQSVLTELDEKFVGMHGNLDICDHNAHPEPTTALMVPPALTTISSGGRLVPDKNRG